MEFKEISDLIKLVGKSNLIELRMKMGDMELHLVTDKHGKSSPKPAPVSVLGSHIPGVSAAPAAAPTAISTPVPGADTSSTDSGDKTDAGDANQTDENLLEIRSPMVGTFYRAPSADKGPYIKVGDTIETGSVVCIVEAMKLFNEIESEISGKIVKVMVEDAAPVEYDQVLFLVEA